MEQTKFRKSVYENAAWGLLLILWGITILFDFIPFGIGVAGTGLILLGVNAMRSLNHVQTNNDNNLLGILMLGWGGLELARPILRTIFQSADLDWVIFAILLIGLGLILLLHGWFHSWRIGLQRE